MKYSTSSKFTLLIVAGFFGLITCNYLRKDLKQKTRISQQLSSLQQTCEQFSNEMYGKGIDSVKACQCIVAEYFEVVKGDSAFYSDVAAGRRKLDFQDDSRLGLQGMLLPCLRSAVIQPDSMFHFTELFGEALKGKVLIELGKDYRFDTFDKKIMSDCIVRKMDNHISYREALGDQVFLSDEVESIVAQCAADFKSF